MQGPRLPAYACGCLNVRVTPVPQFSDRPDLPVSTPEFKHVHVADEGISVAHPQVTLRIRTRGELASLHRRARYTSLTCLVCKVLVYRVHQIVSLDADGRDGPLMPTEDWVEQDILKSPSGWIEVHTQCLTGDAIARAEASPHYSALFSLAIPIAGPPPASPQPANEDVPSVQYLAHLPPLFLPPPFTPAHPVFAHLVSLAKAESDAQRAAVEAYMAEVMRAKSAQLADTEALLRRQVETVWRKFREGLQSVEPLDTTGNLASPRSPRSPRSPTSRTTSGSVATPASPTVSGTPVAIVRDFVPLQVSPARQARPATKSSSLSASLATSGFHHPRAQQGEPPSPPRPESTLSSSSRTLSGSSPTLAGSPRVQPAAPVRIFEEGASVLQFGRKLDEDINTAASYKFFQNLEADMARSKREQQLREIEKTVPHASASGSSSSAAPLRDAGPSHAGPSTVNGNRKDASEKNGVRHDERMDEAAGESSVRDKSKGKRKMVTFESQPAVVTIKREVIAEKEEEARLARSNGEEMIFDLEPEGEDRDSAEGAVMTFVEQPPQLPRVTPPRRQRKEPTDSTGLPQSFSALRPATLPLPSDVHRRRGAAPLENDTTSGADAEEEETEEEGAEEVAEEYDSRDVEILKLVAANTPSHRGAWKKGSAEWQSLVGRIVEQEDEDLDPAPPPPPHVNGSSHAGMPGSMPIAIRPLSKPQANLSLASYRPATMPPAPVDADPTPEPSTPFSSSSVRRAVYAERDLQRAMDPGALDFAADDGHVLPEEDEDNDGGHQASSTTAAVAASEGSGRRRASQILQARNELPDSGLWRSLVS
ncbi:hypothetical protein B0H15DRAFT_588519 [Mycena belliarum]|uniref:Uncharacterized protein n=1 Tax=Mycena belliarum TaxID=1033014 RepID=A0AAD6UDW4_9AGAR|nr:hypothetical protein B0H15DRAFT_588519 [Mycena belliae]